MVYFSLTSKSFRFLRSLDPATETSTLWSGFPYFQVVWVIPNKLKAENFCKWPFIELLPHYLQCSAKCICLSVYLFILFKFFPLNFYFHVQRLEKQRHRCYEELRERIEREKKMQKVSEELELQKHLMVCGN